MKLAGLDAFLAPSGLVQRVDEQHERAGKQLGTDIGAPVEHEQQRPEHHPEYRHLVKQHELPEQHAQPRIHLATLPAQPPGCRRLDGRAGRFRRLRDVRTEVVVGRLALEWVAAEYVVDGIPFGVGRVGVERVAHADC